MHLLRRITILSVLIYFKVGLAQENTLKILDENGIITSDFNGKLFYMFKIESENPDFKWDSYKFIIPNQKNFDEYYSVDDMKKEINIDSINTTTLKNLAKEMTNWEIHNFLSKKREVYLISKSKNKMNSKKYYSYPLIYQGTQKDIEVLNLH